MATVLMLTEDSPLNVLPALGLLAHEVRQSPPHLTAVLSETPTDVVVLDARADLAERRTFAQLLRSTGLEAGLILVLSEGGLAVVTADWGADDVVVATASPAEVEARIRLVMQRSAQQTVESPEIHAGAVTINEATYTARVGKRTLDLTYKEFELLKYLAQHPGRVFSREQLLHEVWGYDYFGGTRTVDVHVRRLRAKLGSEYEGLIGTVRNVGYRFVVPQDDPAAATQQAHAELS